MHHTNIFTCLSFDSVQLSTFDARKQYLLKINARKQYLSKINAIKQ